MYLQWFACVLFCSFICYCSLLYQQNIGHTAPNINLKLSNQRSNKSRTCMKLMKHVLPGMCTVGRFRHLLSFLRVVCNTCWRPSFTTCESRHCLLTKVCDRHDKQELQKKSYPIPRNDYAVLSQHLPIKCARSPLSEPEFEETETALGAITCHRLCLTIEIVPNKIIFTYRFIFTRGTWGCLFEQGVN